MTSSYLKAGLRPAIAIVSIAMLFLSGNAYAQVARYASQFSGTTSGGNAYGTGNHKEDIIWLTWDHARSTNGTTILHRQNGLQNGTGMYQASDDYSPGGHGRGNTDGGAITNNDSMNFPLPGGGDLEVTFKNIVFDPHLNGRCTNGTNVTNANKNCGYQPGNAQPDPDMNPTTPESPDCSFNTTNCQSWPGSGFQYGYNIEGYEMLFSNIGPGRNSSSGIEPGQDAQEIMFDVDFKMTVDGVSIPVDVVFTDTETTNPSSGFREVINAVSSGADWQLIESVRSTNYDATASTNGNAKHAQITDTEREGTPRGVPIFLTNGTSDTTTISYHFDYLAQAGGHQGIVIGVLYPKDHGDAPVSYGDATHFQDMMGDPNNDDLTNASPLYLGSSGGAGASRGDTESSAFFSDDATGDDSNNSGSANDENGWVSSGLKYKPEGGMECEGANGKYITQANEYCAVVSVTNTTNGAVQAVGWLDFGDGTGADFTPDGKFDANEMSLPDLGGDGIGALVADTGDNTADDTFTTGNIEAGFSGNVVLVWTDLGDVDEQSPDSTFLRLRLTSHGRDNTPPDGFFSDSSPSPTGPVTDGEVEDHLMAFDVLPVTLSHFDSSRSGNKIDITWSTSSELFNVGFQLWGLDGVDGEWDKLHNWLIKSGSGNAVEPQSYAKRVKIPNSIDQLVSVGLSSVDSDGSEHYYGPFELGESYGELGQLEPIAWDAVRAELDASMLAQGYVKDRVHGYRKVAVSEAGAVQSAASSTQTVIEFRVREDGLYRLTSSELSAAGMDLSGALKRDIAIIDSAGDAVVRYVKSGKTFGSKGEVYFYGQGPDETAGIYTESSVYRLVLDRYRALNAPKQGKQGVSSGFSAHYVETSAVEQDNIYLFSSSADDPWVTQVLVSEPGKPRLYGLSVPIEADALSSEPKHIALGLGKSSALGGVGDEHEVQGVVLSPAGENGVLYLASRASSSGSGLWEVLLEIPSGTPLTVTDGEAVVGGLFSVGSGYAFSEVHLDSMGLRYARPYVSKAGDNYLIFTAPNDGELGYEVEVPNKGYPWVFATDGSNLVRLIPENAPKSTNADGEQVRTVRFAALAGAGLLSEGEALRYWVGARTQALSVEGLIEKSVVSQADLVAQAGGSNYLLISHPSFLGSALDAYVLHKQGEGYGVSVINYLEIEDSFGGGQSGPAGLTRYISAVKAAYGQLDYVLVVGGSTYDHTDKLGTGAVTFIPGHYGESNHSQYTVSDVPYVQDEAGGLFASIGRWPVRTMDDVQAIVDKSMAWGTPTHTSSESLLIAEHTMAGEGIDFGGALDGIAQVFGGFYDQSRVYVDSILADLVDALMASDPTLTQAEARAQALPQAIGQAKGEIIGELSGTSGAPSPDIVLYNGHASTGQLSNYNLFKSSDVSGLVDAVGSELWVPMSCYVTWYEGAAVNSLAHQLLFTGNAMTITGAMLLSNHGENIQMGTSILNSTVNEGSTLGEAVNEAKAVQNNPNVDINWAILGDPTVSLSSP